MEQSRELGNLLLVHVGEAFLGLHDLPRAKFGGLGVCDFAEVDAVDVEVGWDGDHLDEVVVHVGRFFIYVRGRVVCGG